MTADQFPKPHIDGFIGLPSDEYIKDEVVNLIINNGHDGVCYTNLRKLYGSAIRNWLPKLMKNDYQGLNDASYITMNFASVEALGVCFKSRKCNCGRRQCRRFYALDRKVDPAKDLGVPAYQVIFHPSTWKMSHTEFKYYLKGFFSDPENLLAQEIDRHIEEERLEEYREEI
tara:strand:+ start:499 stop:1014 length:516 start_codon:yes stop_codon:yes gene_type:complete